MSDSYLDPRSGILRNRFGLTDQNSLDVREADAVTLRSVLLQLNPIEGNFESDHLKRIHEYLFRDVYEWAGQFRTIPLAKADYSHGGRVTRFTPPELIDAELEKVFHKLAEENFFAGMQRKKFSRRTAWLLSEMNRIHPFREGNGRAQRQFVRQLCNSIGFKLHFEVVSKERLIQASILSASGDLSMMERLTDEISDTERIQPLAKLIAHFDKHAFGWNDHYLATTTPGRSYTGKFAGSDGANFFFYEEDNHILVGRAADLSDVPKPGTPISFTSS